MPAISPIGDEEDMTSQVEDRPVLDTLAEMTADSLAHSTLDPRSLMLVRLAALAATGAPPLSYLLNLGIGSEIGLERNDAEAVLIAVAPIVGTARVVAATGNIARALGLAIAVAETESEAESAGDSMPEDEGV
jgi:hypothetical protein